MKEKVTMFLTMSAIFSLFLYYKLNPQNSAEFTQVKVENEVEDVQPQLIFEVNSEDVSEQDKSDFCLMIKSESDELDFSKAFHYYRNCLDEEKIFTWNGNEYTTFFAEELNIQNTSLSEVEEDSKKASKENQLSVDKTHMQLQNEMFGNSSNE